MTFRELLPDEVAVAEGRVDDDRWARVVPLQERGLVTGRRERVQEFVAGRGCARAAMSVLGVDAPVIAIGADRGPVWPPGVVGAVTHAGGEVAAAVSTDPRVLGVGLDVEPVAVLDDATAEVVSSGVERERAAQAGLDALGALAVFCAKEAVFKAWAPRHGWLDFAEAAVDLRADGTLVAEVGATTLAGRWLRDATHVRAAVVLTHDPGGPGPARGARVLR